MKRLITTFSAVLLGMTLLVSQADAKRLGGGSSTGMQRSTTSLQKPAAPTSAPTAAPNRAAPAAQPAPQPAGNRWLGPLAGLAAGVGLGALLGGAFGGGMGGGGLLTTLLIAVVAFFAIRLIMGMFKRNAPQARPMAYAPAGANASPFEAPGREVPIIGGGLSSQGQSLTAPQGGSIPADFDVEGFVRQAKVNFIRLQAANDAGNMEDIREVTTPEMYAEIKMQRQEQGSAPQQTDVINLNADLLDVNTEAHRHIASVRFFGSIREEKNGPVAPFDEVWHLVKPTDGSHGWLIAGIQQMQ